jgi:SAM-dependent methyltransferase
MSECVARLRRRKGDYGFDAPYVPLALGGAGGVLALLTLVFALVGVAPLAIWAGFVAVWLLLSTASFVYTTRAGKLAVWAEILCGLGLAGDEQVLDLGCGRGAILLMAAALLPRGKATGVDLWKSADQSGNSPDVAWRNAEREGVADRVALETGDMQALPFPDGTFDVVLSSLAIHNIPELAGRMKAIEEAARVLKPAGRLLIADFRGTREYAERLQALGMDGVAQRGLGWRFWYGGPWGATKLVTARKPE